VTHSRTEIQTGRKRRAPSAAALADSLAHVRWIAGGTGAGKSTVARALADRYSVDVYAGDRAQHSWLPRCTSERQPRMAAGWGLPPGGTWDGRTPEEVFRSMASLHGETIGFVVQDLLAMPADRTVLVDWFGNLPRDLAPLLRWPGQAVFLVPTPQFRRDALGARYADPDRARANWGDRDPQVMLAKRLARDALWDAEVRRQAEAHGLEVVTVDGSRSAAQTADYVAARFRIGGEA
jgi:hypothetical protein